MTTTSSTPDGPAEKAAKPENSYGAGDIQVLEGLEAVRKRPGMYIGSTGPRGLHHLVYEIVDNSVDEALAGHCDTIHITLLADGGVRVVDNGRGIPVDEHPVEKKSTVEVVLTILHAGGKFGGGGYAVSGGLHGVGSSVVNALSERLEVAVRRQGNVYTQSYKHGVPDAPLAKGETTSETGTTIAFWPNGEIFETIEFDYDTLRTRFQQMAFLNKGLRITITDERADGLTEDGPRHEEFLYEKGLVDYVEYLNSAKKIDHRVRVGGHRAAHRARGRHAVDDRVLGIGAHLREHHQHPRGGNARGGLPRRAHDPREQVRPRQGHPQGEGREPLGRRCAGRPDGGHLHQAR